ncbi:hypothetical protein ABLE92_15180 [Gordonia sp. VNQ95]|jgi:hypothetical protein|uniref:type II toxin-antitoxin system VapB family antitoxin n=1 Tax=Gordonia sp. VNQ95 TaxID=3156619 RepID=UPI0032B45779
MAELLITGLSDATVTELDRAADERGLSRNEYLRRLLECGTTSGTHAVVTTAELRRAADTVTDLADDAVMDRAWR